jgi:hypothetical protein
MPIVVFACSACPARSLRAAAIFNELVDPGTARALCADVDADAPIAESALLITMGDLHRRFPLVFGHRWEWPLLDPGFASTDAATEARLRRHVEDLVTREGWRAAAMTTPSAPPPERRKSFGA